MWGQARAELCSRGKYDLLYLCVFFFFNINQVFSLQLLKLSRGS